jgi:hypothetical protein
MYKIILKGRTQDEIEIDDEEYQDISENLNRVKLIKLKNGMIINAVDIKVIEPAISDRSCKEAKLLPEYSFSEDNEMSQIRSHQAKERIFNMLKGHGCFQGYNNYDEFTNREISDEKL